MDLARALTDAADCATADRSPLRAAPLLPRIHRRRNLRRGGDALAGVAAAGLVALGIAALGGGRSAPPPPAATTSSPAPSPLPSPSASTEPASRAWPAAVTVPAIPACGERLPAIDAPAAPAMTLGLQAPSFPLPADRVTPLTTGIVLPEDVTARQAGAMQLALVKDGTVVSLVPEAQEPPGGAASYAFTECGGSSPVPAGEYSLYAFRTLTGDTHGAGQPYRGDLVLAAGPVPLTLSAAAGTAPVPDLAACGTRPDAVSDAGLWVGNYGGGTETDGEAPVDLDWSIIATDDLSNRTLVATILHLWLVDEGGTVVAVPAIPLPATSALPMHAGSEGGGAGSEGRLQTTTTFVACPDGTGAVPPGGYAARVDVRIDGGPSPLRARGAEPVVVP